MRPARRAIAFRFCAALPALLTSIAIGQTDLGSESLDERLAAVERRAVDIRDLVASFEERKHTALLKKPLVSTGRILILGNRALWKTEKPHPSVMVMEPAAIRIYYPERGVLEIYDLDERMTRLAISPLPRFSELRARFVIEELSHADAPAGTWSSQYLALRLTPKESALSDYVDHVDVILDTETTFVVRARILDPDGDTTELIFSDVKTNTGLSAGDVELAVPAGTTESRPLAGLRSTSPDEAEKDEP